MTIFNKVNLFFTHLKPFFSYLFCSIGQNKEGHTYAYSLYRKANLAEFTATEQRLEKLAAIAENDPDKRHSFEEEFRSYSMDHELNYPYFLERRLFIYEKKLQLLIRGMTMIFILTFVSVITA